MAQLRLLADRMLGTLAKKLRLLGLDTAYIRDADLSETRYIIRSENRILLTRAVNLSKSLCEHSWHVTGSNVREEFISIAWRLAAAGSKPDPFSRCLECNSILQAIDPSEVGGKVPAYVQQTVDTYSYCPSCEKILWKGTHSNKMEADVKWMEGRFETKNRKQSAENQPRTR